jgi:hypothetical protein
MDDIYWYCHYHHRYCCNLPSYHLLHRYPNHHLEKNHNHRLERSHNHHQNQHPVVRIHLKCFRTLHNSHTQNKHLKAHQKHCNHCNPQSCCQNSCMKQIQMHWSCQIQFHMMCQSCHTPPQKYVHQIDYC